MCFISPSVPCSSSQANLQAPINFSFAEPVSDFSADCGLEAPVSVSTVTAANIQPKVVLMSRPPPPAKRRAQDFLRAPLASFVVDDFALQSSLRLSRKIPTSLSPRPDTFTITIADYFILGARLITSATAFADSKAGIIPSVRARNVVASSASASEAGRYSARPASRNAACSGPIEG